MLLQRLWIHSHNSAGSWKNERRWYSCFSAYCGEVPFFVYCTIIQVQCKWNSLHASVFLISIFIWVKNIFDHASFLPSHQYLPYNDLKCFIILGKLDDLIDPWKAIETRSGHRLYLFSWEMMFYVTWTLLNVWSTYVGCSKIGKDIGCLICVVGQSSIKHI